MRGSQYEVKDGERFGRLTVLKELDRTFDEAKKLKRPILCMCECGNEKTAYLATLKAGKVTSCGCLRTPDIKSGTRYGRLTVVQELERSTYSTKFRRILCKCDCGNDKIANLTSLTFGVTKSCGCLQPETAKASKTTHGLSGTSLSTMFKHMKSRCYNTNDPYYRYYGGRGIVICDKWLKGGLAVFAAWAKNNGWREGLTIERNDYNGDYEPNNCSFATEKEQANNKSSNLWIKDGDAYVTLSMYNEVAGIVKYATARYRIHRENWTPWQAVNIPPSLYRRITRYHGRVTTIEEICKAENLPMGLICERVLKGWPIEKATATPPGNDHDKACLEGKPVAPRFRKPITRCIILNKQMPEILRVR